MTWPRWVLGILCLFILPGGEAFPSASFHGFPLDQLEQESRVRVPDDAMVSPGVFLLPVDPAKEAANARARGMTLEESFAAEGLQFLGIVGREGVLLYSDGNLGKRAEAFPVLGEHRFAPEVREILAQPAEDETLLIVNFAGSGIDLLAALAKHFPDAVPSESVQRGTRGRVGLRVLSGKRDNVLAYLAVHPVVYSVQLGGGARMHNFRGRRVVQSATNDPGGETLWQRGLRGEGQVIAFLDTGADVLNCYLAEEGGVLPPVIRGADKIAGDPTRRKIIAYNMLFEEDDPADGFSAYDNQGHGTLVAGNAGGSRLDDPFGTGDAVQNGPAPAAQFVIQDAGFTGFDDCSDLAALGCPVVTVTPFLEQAYFQGARFHNNSWGDREEFFPQNTYTNISEDMDEMTWRHPDFLILCAAGNSGSRGNDSVGSPSTGKNVLSIGGVNNPGFDSIISFSSRGWASDGRIKPDLVATARTETSRWIVSEELHCSERVAQGTSMASPMAAGAAALARQYFTEGWYPTGAPNANDAMTTPSAALLKAVLINGADAVGSEPAPPSRGQGWGRIHLERALYFAGDDRRLLVEDHHDYFAHAATASFELEVELDGLADDLRITLVYTDYPATPGAEPALVNDLDLQVIAPDGTAYYGNSFSEGELYSEAGGVPDQVNNVEVVRLPAVEGTWTVRILPSAIIHGPQGFALALSGPIALEPPSSVLQGWMLY